MLKKPQTKITITSPEKMQDEGMGDFQKLELSFLVQKTFFYFVIESNVLLTEDQGETESSSVKWRTTTVYRLVFVLM